MRRLLLAVVIFGAVSGARAADMPDLPVLRGTQGLSVSTVNWQGVYFGGQVEYGSITSKISPSINGDLESAFVPPTGIAYNWRSLGFAQTTSPGYGAFAGYNSQWDDVVVGIEANYIHDGFKSTSSSTGLTFDGNNALIATTGTRATVGVSDFGTLRLRAAYVAGCFLPYMFVGGGLGAETVDRVAFASPAPALQVGVASASETKLVYGYSAGFGFDVMLVGGLFARAEYEYRHVTSNIESNINSLRAGLGYKF
jgi:opacity protein-like surface antigen